MCLMGGEIELNKSLLLPYLPQQHEKYPFFGLTNDLSTHHRTQEEAQETSNGVALMGRKRQDEKKSELKFQYK